MYDPEMSTHYSTYIHYVFVRWIFGKSKYQNKSGPYNIFWVNLWVVLIYLFKKIKCIDLFQNRSDKINKSTLPK